MRAGGVILPEGGRDSNLEQGKSFRNRVWELVRSTGPLDPPLNPPRDPPLDPRVARRGDMC